jgi:hypothetical protein
MRAAMRAATRYEIARQQIDSEEDLRGCRNRQAERLEKPQRQQPSDDQAAGEGIDVEQRGEPEHNAARRTERCGHLNCASP